jgi:hypothetical protein
MTSASDLEALFQFDPNTPRIVGFGSSAGIARDDQATAIAVCAELLHPEKKQPSGKWLFLQLQPRDALALVAAILAHAKEKNWSIDSSLLDAIERIKISPENKKH